MVNVPIEKRRRYSLFKGGSTGAGRFPIYSRQTAESAMHLIGKAKSEAEKEAIRRRAAKYGVGPYAKKSKK